MLRIISKNFNQTRSLYGALKPLLILSKIFGIFPNQMKQSHGNHCRRFFTFDTVWSLLFTTVIMIYSFYSVHFKNDNTQNILETISDSLLVNLGLLTNIMIVLNQIVMIGKLDAVFNKLIKFDEMLKQFEPTLRITESYQELKAFLIVATITIIVPILQLISQFVLYVNDFNLITIGAEIVAYSIPTLVIFLTVGQFSVIVSLARQRFKWINSKLIKLQANYGQIKRNGGMRFQPIFRKFDESNLSWEDEQILTNLETLRRYHYNLTEICGEINQVYTLPILLITIYVFLTEIITIFFFFKQQSLYRDKSPVIFSIYHISVLSINCFELLSMVIVSTLTSKEAKRTRAILHDFQAENLEEYLTYFSLQIFHNEITFRGCNILTLNGNLVFSIVGSTTTYLVIIIQLVDIL